VAATAELPSIADAVEAVRPIDDPQRPLDDGCSPETGATADRGEPAPGQRTLARGSAQHFDPLSHEDSDAARNDRPSSKVMVSAPRIE
jgi:hypothetical protein